ncbi:MAG: nucleotidyl transferase AbiEii/AbiGii toxin family protein [Coprobacillus sp.]|nr:nucleotidyl transferase AbiEii/AbiGii toxin family protein [Coprobacillus sp.]
MNLVLEKMINGYKTDSIKDKTNAIREVMQRVTLSSLASAGFNKEAIFFGGTSLRIFYQIGRFSEDLDFSLVEDNPDFNFSKYIPSLVKSFSEYGIDISVTGKEKSNETTKVHTYFINFNLNELLSYFFKDSSRVNHNELIRIKLDIDTESEKNANTNTLSSYTPRLFQYKVFDFASLLSLKIGAILTRNYKFRVKGRDLYDFIFLASQNSEVNLPLIKEELVRSNYIDKSFDFTLDTLKEMLTNYFNNLDFQQAKADVYPFIDDPRELDFFNKDAFIPLVNALKVS